MLNFLSLQLPSFTECYKTHSSLHYVFWQSSSWKSSLIYLLFSTALQTTGLTTFPEKGWWGTSGQGQRATTSATGVAVAVFIASICFSLCSCRGCISDTHLSPAKAGSFAWVAADHSTRGTWTSLYKYLDAKSQKWYNRPFALAEVMLSISNLTPQGEWWQ